MGFLDKLSANLTNETRKLSQKVKNSSDASKLMSEITAENRNIQENLISIGKLYYDMCKDSPDEPFRLMVEAVIKSEQRIAELQESIKIIRSREPELVAVPEDNSGFPGVQQPAPSVMVCMGCGNTYPGGTGFCSVCGQKLVPQYQSPAAAAAAPAQTAADVQFRPEEPLTEAEKSEIPDADFAEIPPNEENISETPNFCPFCGEKITDSTQAFCGKCGHAIH